MGWLSRLFTGKQQKPAVEIEPYEYKGYLIYAEPIAENGQYRIAGRIVLNQGEAQKTHRFIRSDLLISQGDAQDLMIKKAQMFIDQMGDSIFD
ncbi:HlyU family transcriptional regulator [Vibrio gallicus]|uniref:HlyU family transcriptional regulator n=1 Tax=Vibrio gallicus TaxID=190897 RepID=UPI0021C42A63|nr:HlyU family transcriptional regulator [Vibrio gallicus]